MIVDLICPADCGAELFLLDAGTTDRADDSGEKGQDAGTAFHVEL